MKYLIVGTAGHIDHGKTALVKALTGEDTDRLAEEKRRGISIDLGFAAMPLGADCQAGIVDVPGHERYLKNMLAGTGGIDAAVLVVAANEGVMPQTREHLAMLQLYGVQYGVIALTKCDLVDEDWQDMVVEDVRRAVAGTFLAAAPLYRVSATTGLGLAALRDGLADLARRIPGRDDAGPVKLWLDRAFTVKGFGVVVTGSLLSGRVAPGDTLLLWPAGRTVRVRGVQVHDQDVPAAQAGQRAALNLSGAERADVARGMLLIAPGYGQRDRMWDVAAHWLRPVSSGTAIRLHIGTAEYLGKVYYYKNAPHNFCRLMLTEDLVAGLGDRGIVRRQSPQNLLGGVLLLGPATSPRRQLPASRCGLAAALRRNDDQGVMYHLLLGTPEPLPMAELVRRAGFLGTSRVADALAVLLQQQAVCSLSVGEETLYWHREALTAATEQMLTILKNYHAAHPYAAGMAAEELRRLLAATVRTFAALLAYWQRSGLIVMQGAAVLLYSQAHRLAARLAELTAAAQARLPADHLLDVTAAELQDRLQLASPEAQLLHEHLVRQGVLVKVGDTFVYSKTMQYIVTLIQRHFAAAPTLTVAQFRDMLGTTRKLAIPLLEYCDLHKYTIRQGEVRVKGCFAAPCAR